MPRALQSPGRYTVTTYKDVVMEAGPAERKVPLSCLFSTDRAKNDTID